MESYKCEKCSKIFSNELEYKRHKKNCFKFTGIVMVDREGYRDNLLGSRSINDIWDTLEGKKVCITVID